MKKLLFLFVSALLLVFVSCENFMNGSDVQDQLEQMIDVANAKSFTLVISNDTTMGTFLSSGDKACKVGYSIDVQFNVKKEFYVYKGLKAVNKSNQEESLDDYVEFIKTDSDNTRGVYKTTIKLLKESDDILIIPDCVELPVIVSAECKPDNTRDWDQDSTIQIVFNKPVTTSEFFVPAFTDTTGQNLSEYFEEPYFSADSTVLLIPTNKQTRLLDPNGPVSSKDIIVTIDLSNIIDEEGNTGVGSVQHKYRVGKTFDSIIPVLDAITVFSTSDVNNKNYKELTTTAFASWATGTAADGFGDFGKNRVSNSVYVEFEATDEGSGIGGASVKETHYKYSDGTAAGFETGTFFVPAKKDELTGKYCINYEMNTPGDGIILLDIYAEDYAENISSTSKKVYVLKDTTIDAGSIKFNYEDDAVITSNSNMGLPPDPNEDNSESYSEMLAKINHLYTDNSDGTQTITLSFRDTAVDTFYSGCSSPYELNILWSYDSNDENSYISPIKTNNTYSIRRDPTKIVFIKINCKDSIGNERIVSKIIPPALELQLVYEDNYSYKPANMTTYGAMCLDQISTQPSSEYGVKFLVNCDFKALKNGNYQELPYTYVIKDSDSLSPNINDYLNKYIEWYSINSPDGPANTEIVMYTLQPKGTVTCYATAAFGNFPGPLSINQVEGSITSWKYCSAENYPSSEEAFDNYFTYTDSNGGTRIYGPKTKMQNNQWCLDGYRNSQNPDDIDNTPEYAFAEYAKELGLSNEVATDDDNISEYNLVFGFSTENTIVPINQKIKVDVEPMKNFGVYRINIDDYINKSYPDYDKVTYLFFVDVFFETSGSGSSSPTQIYCEDGYSQREPKIFLSVSDPEHSKYTVRVEAYDKTKKKYFIPVLPLSVYEAVNPDYNGGGYADNPKFVFRNIIRENNLSIGTGLETEYISDDEIFAYYDTLKSDPNWGLLSYIKNNFKLGDYKSLTYEGRMKSLDVEGEDIYQNYNCFKDLTGKQILKTFDLDVTPPSLSMIGMMNSIPFLDTTYLTIPSPSDANPKYIDKNEEKAELSYYIIPSQSNDYTVSTVYSQEELETNFAKYKQTLIYYPAESLTVIPFENTKPGLNIVYIVAEDAFGNSALAYYPVVTTSYGKLPIKKKQINYYETVTESFYDELTNEMHSQSQTYSSPAWEVTLDFTKRKDLLVNGALPEDLNVELQYIAQEYSFGLENTFYWKTPQYDFMSYVNFIDSVEYTPPANYGGPTENDPRIYKVIETDNPLVYKTVLKFPDGNNTGYSENQFRWGRIKASFKNSGQNVAVKEKGRLYYEYIYLGEYGAYCQTKNCIEGLNGYLVYSDKPVLVHTMFSKEKLTNSIYDDDACLIWENEAAETGLKVVNNDEYDPNASGTVIQGYYSNDNKKIIPKGYYYTTIFHFSDGTTIMSDIKQKQ